MPFKPSVSRSLAALAIAATLAACTGGGGDGGSGGGTSPPPPPPVGSPPPSPPPPPPPPVSPGPTYTPGVFQAASLFKNRCAAPRSGRDIEGNTFPDQAGSLVEEMFWIRSWTRETYLWNTEVADRDPYGFTNRLNYFEVMKTNAGSPSGQPKDEFHFTQPTADYLAQRNSAPTAGYGARYVAYATTPPRDFRILYTEPNSPASQVVNGQARFIRGAKILSVDGVDLVNGGATQAQIDTLNNGLFPRTAGESHTFTVQDTDMGVRSVTLTSANVTPTAVNRTATIDTPTGRVGYILFNTFSTFASEQQIANAVTTMRAGGVTDLVLDLRYNGGGLLAVASQLSHMVAGSARTNGRTFEALRFNAAAGTSNPVTGGFNAPTPFYSTGLGFSLANGVTLPTLDLPRVFVLTTAQTCSASESVINSLRGIDVEVVLIGGTTCGKPYGFYPQDNCGETYFTIQFQGVNDKGFGDYADGFAAANSSAAFAVRTPGCAVADDLSRELGDPAEALLAAALQYRTARSCPTPSAVAPEDGGRLTAASAETAILADRSPLEAFLRSNRDMTMPY